MIDDGKKRGKGKKEYTYVHKNVLRLDKSEPETLERRLNPALCVLQTYFRISL